MTDVTQILSQINQGDPAAAEQLFPLVYDELRKLAAAKLSHERPGQTLQATALVHDAYVRLVDVDEAQEWNSRVHFFGAAAEAMRRILVDRARERKAKKRGGGWERIEFDSAGISSGPPVDELLSVNDLFDRLADKHPHEAAVAKLHYFAGFNISEAARALDLPVSSAHRHWAFARAWLIREMRDDA
jgi:RNA polymerase sigma factor (TIGR02999 family)